MFLCLPNTRLPNTDLDMHGAYDQLEVSLGLVREQLGEERYVQLIEMGRQSRSRLEEGQLREGLLLLKEMRSLLGRKTPGTNR
jgi:hypothetical protein